MDSDAGCECDRDFGGGAEGDEEEEEEQDDDDDDDADGDARYCDSRADALAKEGSQGHARTDHGLPRALYNAFSWAPRGSSSQSLQDEALLSMDEVAPGAFVMIVVLVVPTVIISPSFPISLVCVVVVWDELGGGKAGVSGIISGIDRPGASEAFAPPWAVLEPSPQRRRLGSSGRGVGGGGGMGGGALGSAPAHAFGIHSQGIEWFPGTGTQQPGTLMGGTGP